MREWLILLALQASAPASDSVVGTTYRLSPEAAKAACSKQVKGSWVSNSDYPSEALRQGFKGTVHFRLEIAETGCPAACTVTGSSGHKILDQRTCMLMLVRARFKPALNEHGHPIPATWNNKFSWSL
jgi:TonB family protein